MPQHFPKPEKAKKRPKKIMTQVPPGGMQTPGAKELERRLEAERKKRDRAVNNSRST